MKIKTELEKKTELANCIGWCAIWLLMLYAMMLSSGCSFQVGIDWNGKTATDKRIFTDIGSKKTEGTNKY